MHCNSKNIDVFDRGFHSLTVRIMNTSNVVSLSFCLLSIIDETLQMNDGLCFVQNVTLL